MSDVSNGGPRVTALRERYEAAGQGHVLRFLPDLSPEAADDFLERLQALDLDRVTRLVRSVLEGSPDLQPSGDLAPPPLLDWNRDGSHDARDAEARQAGEELLAAGRVGAFLVAGGQGTRLGVSGPKGRFPIGPLTNRTLFAYHAQRVLASSRRYGAALPFYVMTSEVNHQSTVEAFEEARHFGLDPSQVMIFRQGMLPAVDRQGRLLLSARDALAMSPDGHGGCFAALQRSGALDDMRRRGVEQIFYFQVDNPLARVFDPLFIGHHALAGAQMSTKVVEKTDPGEKVGVLASAGGRHCLLEYSDLSDELAGARDAEGRLLYRAGNIAIHMLERAFAERLVSGGLELPVHRADKKVPFVDESGQVVEPDEPNAIKMEMFVFDALGFADVVTNQEVLREDEFAPVKNAEGSDSPATSRAALADQARRWMAAAGLAPPRGEAEVGPLFALDQEAFCANLTRADFGPVFDRS